MMMRWHKSMVIVLLIGAVFLVTGCVTTEPAFYRASEFKSEFIDQITLLPAVDARADKAVAVNLEDWLRVEAAKNLESKGYAVLLSSITRGTSELTYDKLRAADPALIKRLGPPGGRWIMVLALVDLNVIGGQGGSGRLSLRQRKGRAPMAGYEHLSGRARRLGIWNVDKRSKGQKGNFGSSSLFVSQHSYARSVGGKVISITQTHRL